MIAAPAQMRQEFVAQVLRIVGARVAHRGRDVASVDCVGVPIVALRSMGITIEEPERYGRIPDALLMTDYMGRHCDPIAYDEREPGDMLQLMHGERPRHLAVIVGVRGVTSDVVVVDPKAKRVILTTRGPERVRAVWRLKLWPTS